MGKDKDKKVEAPGNAFIRMNFLYQAAQLTTKITETSSLSNYYNKILREISKKVLERLHPDLKRTICCACNYPLTAKSEQINVKIKTHKKKRKKILNRRQNKKEFPILNTSKVHYTCKYLKNRIESRNKKPNKICWSCHICGHSRIFLQRPSHKLWIHQVENKD